MNSRVPYSTAVFCVFWAFGVFSLRAVCALRVFLMRNCTASMVYSRVKATCSTRRQCGEGGLNTLSIPLAARGKRWEIEGIGGLRVLPLRFPLRLCVPFAPLR